VNELRKLIKDHPNIHLMRTRRLVQWGAWTMNLVLLDALHTAVSAGIDFDVVINLSDADIALRTNDEIVTFLREHKGRQFVHVSAPPLWKDLCACECSADSRSLTLIISL
jgi:protein xylosyltransferase